jgi:putative membrane protein
VREKRARGYMPIDIRTLATANLVVQLVLIALILGAVYLARRGRIKRHCTIVRGAVVVQIIAILIVMLPSLLGYVANVPPIPFLYPELLIHHILGLVLIAIFIYVNLEVGHVIRPIVKRKDAMWTALGVWLVALALGIILYLTVYYT